MDALWCDYSLIKKERKKERKKDLCVRPCLSGWGVAYNIFFFLFFLFFLFVFWMGQTIKSPLVS